MPQRSSGRFVVAAVALIVAMLMCPAAAAGGDLDRTFGGDGRVTSNVTPGPDTAEDVVLQPEGKVLVAGRGGNGFALARYDKRGRLDAAFGRGGLILTDVARGNDAAAALAVQPNGRIVAAGSNFGRSDMRSVVVRYRPNGTLDRSFSGDGRIVGPVTSYGATDVAIQADGKILVVGTSGTSFLLTRYERDGSRDPSFGEHGTATVSVTDSFAWGGELAIQADGRILVAGESQHDDLSTVLDLLRFESDGTLDATFGSGGHATADPTDGWDSADSIAIQPDGKIVTAGEAGFCCEYTGSFEVARFHNDGTLDASFGDAGVVVTTFTGPDETEPEDAARGVGIQSDGKIVTVGVAARGWGSTSKIAIARYTVDGSLDDTFGTGGKVQTRFPRIAVREPSNGFVGSWASAVAIQPNGRIVVAGGQAGESRNGAAIGRFVLARYAAA